jgi:predicted DCC family thiol-disulfide oxidoreductase YuxK
VGVSDSGPVLLFDGVCNLCEGSVKWIVKRDDEARFRFASLQSDAADRLLDEVGTTSELDTVILIEDGEAFVKSEAALRVARGLGWPYRALGIAYVFPRRLRDWLYDQVARRRYRLFGKKESCMIPTPELRQRFLSE